MKQTNQIEALLREDARIYVYFRNAQVQAQFIRQATQEHFTFPDGAPLSERELAPIMAINNDKTVNYVGFVGMTAFQCAAKKLGSKPLLRIDYEKYAKGDSEYLREV